MSDPSDIQKDLIVAGTTVAAAGVTAAALYTTQSKQALEDTLMRDAALKEQPDVLSEYSEAVRGEMMRQHEAAMAEVEKVAESSRFKKMAEKAAEKSSKAIGPKLDKAKQAYDHLVQPDLVDYLAFSKPNEAGLHAVQVHLNAEGLEKITKGSDAASLLFKPQFDAAGKATKGSYSLFDVKLPKLPAGVSFKEADGFKNLKGEHLAKLEDSWLSGVADTIYKSGSKLEAAVPELTVNASTIRKAAPMGFGFKLMPAGAKFEIATWAVVAAVAGTYVGGFLTNSLQRSRLSKAAPQTVGESTPFSR